MQLVELSGSLLAIEIPKEAAVLASSELLEDTQGSAWAHCSANVDLTWALVGAGGCPSKLTAFLLHALCLSVIVIRNGLQDSVLFVGRAVTGTRYQRE